jgi:hypothetical protein
MRFDIVFSVEGSRLHKDQSRLISCSKNSALPSALCPFFAYVYHLKYDFPQGIKDEFHCHGFVLLSFHLGIVEISVSGTYNRDGRRMETIETAFVPWVSDLVLST